MIIILGLLGELATIGGSLVIIQKFQQESVLRLAKQGYRMDKDALIAYYLDKLNKSKNTKKFKKGFATFSFLMFILGVNMISSLIDGINSINELVDDPNIKTLAVPLKENEIEALNQLNSKKLKYSFILTKKMEDEEELFGFLGKKPMFVDYGAHNLYYEPLLPLAYTLDEVKRLNEVTELSYKLGNVDGKNIAIIGVDKPDDLFCRVSFKSEENEIKHKFTELSEEEAKDKKFVVYPFTGRNLDKVNNVVENIKQERNNTQPVKNNKPVFFTDYENVLEEQGPVLRRKLY